MKIKYSKIFISSLFVFSSTLAFAENNPKINSYDIQPLLEMHYKKGLKDGAEKAYKEGYINGLEFSKKRLRLYSQKIKAYESGKYLKEYAGKISNPEIYQTKVNDGVKVIVNGCKIEKELTPDEIIDLVHFPMDANEKDKISYESENNLYMPIFDNYGVTNSVDIISRDKDGFNESRPSSPFEQKPSYLHLPNNRHTINKLNSLNYTYAIDGDNIKVIFSSEREKEALIQKLNGK